MVKKAPRSLAENLRQSVVKLTYAYLVLAGAYAIYILASDAWNLVVRSVTFQRWQMFGVLLIVSGAVGYLARDKYRSAKYYQSLGFLLVLAGVALATFTVYSERGMASRGVALYAVPIVSAAVLMRRKSVFTTVVLSIATYVMAATAYFYINFNEGYKIELYSTLGLYSAVFVVVALILGISSKHHSQ